MDKGARIEADEPRQRRAGCDGLDRSRRRALALSGLALAGGRNSSRTNLEVKSPPVLPPQIEIRSTSSSDGLPITSLFVSSPTASTCVPSREYYPSACVKTCAVLSCRSCVLSDAHSSWKGSRTNSKAVTRRVHAEECSGTRRGTQLLHLNATIV